MEFKINESIPDLDTSDNIYNNLSNILNNYNIIENTKRTNIKYYGRIEYCKCIYTFEYITNETAYDEYTVYEYPTYTTKSLNIYVGCCDGCIIYYYSNIFKHNNITPRTIIEYLIN
jgi:hypothetical protein